jgi:hypothetical protein
VLYVESATASAKYLQGALDQSGFDVTLRAPSAIPVKAADLEPYDVVILSDVARTSVSDASMKALAEWVELDGGGLLVAGGRAVFGEGSPLAAETPARTAHARAFGRTAVARLSSSTVVEHGGSVMGSARRRRRPHRRAGRRHSVSVVTFNDGLNWDVTLRNVGKSRGDQGEDRHDRAGGHTLIFPRSNRRFSPSGRARTKHVISSRTAGRTRRLRGSGQEDDRRDPRCRRSRSDRRPTSAPDQHREVGGGATSSPTPRKYRRSSSRKRRMRPRRPSTRSR